MNRLNQLRIRSRIIVVIVASCLATAVALSISMFLLQEYLLRRTAERNLAALSRVVAAQGAGPLVFKDQGGADELLGALGANPEILRAAFFLPDGSEFARLGRAASASAWQPLPSGAPHWDGRTRLQVGQPVSWQGDQVGLLRLEADLSEAYRQRQHLSLGIFAVTLAGAVLIGFGIAALIQGVISVPLLRLTDAARTIAKAKDYSLRVPPSTGGEIGWLTDAFNEMLGKIQGHDETLRRTNRELAGEISERLRTEEALRERLRLEAMSAGVGHTLTLKGTMHDMLQGCCQSMATSLNAALVRVWTLEEESRQPELRATAGVCAQPEGRRAPVPLGQGLVGDIVESRKPLMVDSATLDARVQEPDWLRQEHIVAFAGFPLLLGEKVLGVLAVFTQERLSAPTTQAIEGVSNALVLGIERKRAEAALEESEKRFRDVFENATVGIYRTSREGRILMANPALISMLGYDSVEQLRLRNLDVEGYVDPSDRLRFRELVESQGQVRGFVAQWRRRDGKVLIISENAKAIRDDDGSTQYYEGIVEDITARTAAEAELARLNQDRMNLSRRAGMAEVATGVLHNVGNVLNSVNVSVNLLHDGLSRSRLVSLQKTADLLRAHEADRHAYLTTDPKGQLIPDFIIKLSEALTAEQRLWRDEVQGLVKNIEHVKEIVAMQQSYARVAGVIEALPAAQLVEDALRINEAGLTRHGIRLIREFEPVPPVAVDKHKVLQILTNLIHNAKYALDSGPAPDKQLRISVAPNGAETVRIVVRDNGIGIPAENITRIFSHGFTTRADGHGFGLHSGALAAKEMGGSLTAHSDGVGHGATFTLELPIAELHPPSL